MIRAIFISIFLLAAVAHATTGQITLPINGGGGLTLTTTGLIVIRAVNATTGKTHFSINTPGGATRGVYQVTAGKTFVAHAYCVEVISATANTVGNQIFYADNDVGVESATAGTNPVGFFSGSTADATDYAMGAETNAGMNVQRCYVSGGSAPAQKYMYSTLSIRAITTIYGYEI